MPIAGGQFCHIIGASGEGEAHLATGGENSYYPYLGQMQKNCGLKRPILKLKLSFKT